MDKIRGAKCKYLEHVFRGNKLVSQILMGKFRDQKLWLDKENLVDNIKDWTDLNLEKLP